MSELVVDKLPSTPNRTEPAGLITRAALGTVAGGLLASGPRHARLTSAIVGGATAVAAAFGGMAARSALTRRMPRLSAAAVEDAAAIVLAAAAIRVAARA